VFKPTLATRLTQGVPWFCVPPLTRGLLVQLSSIEERGVSGTPSQGTWAECVPSNQPATNGQPVTAVSLLYAF
jgi:hypothetical protein